jgi:hypothetical protein
MQEDCIEQYALELLQAIRDPPMPPHLRGGMGGSLHGGAGGRPQPRFSLLQGTMEYLQVEGVLERAEETRELVGKPLYTITLRGMEMLREV